MDLDWLDSLGKQVEEERHVDLLLAPFVFELYFSLPGRAGSGPQICASRLVLELRYVDGVNSCERVDQGLFLLCPHFLSAYSDVDDIRYE